MNERRDQMSGLRVVAALTADRVDDEDGSAVVMVGQQVIALSPLGATLLELCGAPRAVDRHLVDEVVRRLGDPGDLVAAGLVQAAVDDLLTRGLLVTSS